MRAFAVGLLLAVPGGGLAQAVGECDWRASARVIAEPWEASTRTFAEGDIRLTVMDVGEPVAGSYYLMIISPPYGDGGRQCVILSFNAAGTGFAGLSLEGAKAAYDATTGLSVTMPARRWLPETDSYADATLLVTVNQDTGAITGQLD